MQTPRPKTLGEVESDTDDDATDEESADEFRSPRIPSIIAHVAVVAFALLAAGGMFLLPSLRAAGLSFLQSFLAVAAVEMVAGVGAGYAALHLYLVPGAS